MSNQRKKSVEAALHKYLERDIKELNKLNGITQKRKHGKPEKEVEEACLIYMRSLGWEVQIIESKATQVNGVWRQQSVKAGNADCEGVMPDGNSVSVEFKAPGKLATFNQERNYRQKEFILRRINMNSFACVVDSADRLKEIYERWAKIKEINPAEAKHYLLSMLP